MAASASLVRVGMLGFLMIGELSCSTPTNVSSATGLDIKARVDAASTGDTTVRVYLEGSDGNQVTGARVLVETPGHSVSQLDFSVNRGCYVADLTGANSGNYVVTVDSGLLTHPKRVTLPLRLFSASPMITEMSDGAGANALAGETLSTNLPVQVRWNSLEAAVVYVVKLSFGATVAWKATVTDNLCELPAGAVTSGNYTLQVRAQYLQGDPYLITTDTFSSSESQASSVVAVFN